MGQGKLLRSVYPGGQRFHQARHVFGFGGQVNDAAGAAVADDVLAIAIMRGFDLGFAADIARAWRVWICARGWGRAQGGVFEPLEGGVIAEDFAFVAAPRPGKCSWRSSTSADWFLREAVALDLGGIMSGKKPSGFAERGQDGRRDGEELHGGFCGLDAA